MPSLIIGFVGQAGCGKGTIAKYFKETYGATTFSFSTSMRDVLKRLHISDARDNIIKLSESLRATFGEDIFSKVIAADAREAKTDIVIIEGVRRPQDIVTLSPLPNFFLVAIDASPEARYVRMKNRGQNAGETDMSWEQFLAEEQRSTEASIPGVMTKATHRIKNEGNLEDLHKEIERLMSELKK